MMPMVPKEDVSPVPSRDEVKRQLDAFIANNMAGAAPMMQEIIAKGNPDNAFEIVTMVSMVADMGMPGAEQARSLMFNLAIYGAGAAIAAE